MLILARRPGQSIYVGSDIKITIIDNQYDSLQVKIGIQAPDDVTVLREEILEKYGKKDSINKKLMRKTTEITSIDDAKSLTDSAKSLYLSC